jgi:hypothetical protein
MDVFLLQVLPLEMLDTWQRLSTKLQNKFKPMRYFDDVKVFIVLLKMKTNPWVTINAFVTIALLIASVIDFGLCILSLSPCILMTAVSIESNNLILQNDSYSLCIYQLFSITLSTLSCLMILVLFLITMTFKNVDRKPLVIKCIITETLSAICMLILTIITNVSLNRYGETYPRIQRTKFSTKIYYQVMSTYLTTFLTILWFLKIGLELTVYQINIQKPKDLEMDQVSKNSTADGVLYNYHQDFAQKEITNIEEIKK